VPWYLRLVSRKIFAPPLNPRIYYTYRMNPKTTTTTICAVGRRHYRCAAAYTADRCQWFIEWLSPVSGDSAFRIHPWVNQPDDCERITTISGIPSPHRPLRSRIARGCNGNDLPFYLVIYIYIYIYIYMYIIYTSYFIKSTITWQYIYATGHGDANFLHFVTSWNECSFN